jgi:hypothetical protein
LLFATFGINSATTIAMNGTENSNKSRKEIALEIVKRNLLSIGLQSAKFTAGGLSIASGIFGFLCLNETVRAALDSMISEKSITFKQGLGVSVIYLLSGSVLLAVGEKLLDLTVYLDDLNDKLKNLPK